VLIDLFLNGEENPPFLALNCFFVCQLTAKKCRATKIKNVAIAEISKKNVCECAGKWILYIRGYVQIFHTYQLFISVLILLFFAF